MSSFGVIALAEFPLNTAPDTGNTGNSFAESTSAKRHCAIAFAAKQAGEKGAVSVEFSDLENASTMSSLLETVSLLVSVEGGGCGIKYGAGQSPRLDEVLKLLARDASANFVIIVPSEKESETKAAVEKARKLGLTVIVECVTLEEALASEKLRADALIAKGHESGGRIGENTTFVLLQELKTRVKLPVWAQGGIGLYSAAAALTAGVAGVVLDAQLMLSRESSLSPETKQKIAGFDGTEPSVHRLKNGQRQYRFIARAGHPIFETRTEDELKSVARTSRDAVHFVGQDVSLSADLAKRFVSVSGIAQAVVESAFALTDSAARLLSLKEEAPLAVSHGTRYPIVQGAMTRVSDNADFALAVADGGALPFLALALMRKDECDALLAETAAKLAGKAWGVGILGFVPVELRQEQFEVISRYKPPFALIAGGRPDQAKAFEALGIKTYLHVPSPLLLASFMEMGARRFIFEGRECGGHVGPRSSFVLWEKMIATILSSLNSREDAAAYHVLFAGGVHDALSAAMVQSMAAPLAERGINVGVLVGTAYLFTKEAVETGAIVQKFQEAALSCNQTVLLETGPGHAIRCIDSPYKKTFDDRRDQLLLSNKSRDEIREELELMNLGRLRIASKGLARVLEGKTRQDVIDELKTREAADGASSKLTSVSKEKQWSDGMYMIGQVASMHQSVTTVADLHATISNGATEFLSGRTAKQTGAAKAAALKDGSPSPSERNRRDIDVAIVGMSCIFPKANDVETYWQNILNKVDTIVEIPPEQWDWREYYDENPLARDKIYSKWGGFIDYIQFEPAKYGIPPSSLSSIDPMQILLLEVTDKALDDAGYGRRPFPRGKTSVILANAGHGPVTALYSLRSMLGWKLAHLDPSAKTTIEKALPEWTEDSFPGYLGNVAAGRVANRFDLGGVNFSIDAACASSLAALYTAMGELRSGQSDLIMLGAVDTHNQPSDYLSFSKTHAFSKGGRCRTFDATADGIVISEGVAMIILKRLRDAERDGDKIYAVIRGVGGSSDGRDLSLTAPRPAGQMLALSRAYADADVSPSTVTLVEAHGTGTVAGDKAEIEALKQVYEREGALKRSCAVGSVKTMIGHTKAAAGLASVIKIARALSHKVLPPTMGVTVPNPACDFENSPFYINSELRPWLNTNDSPRRAGVSAFGFGGTNFHTVLEEYTPVSGPEEVPPSKLWPGELFLLKAENRGELIKAVKSLAETIKRTLKDDNSASFTRLAYNHNLKTDEKSFESMPLCLSLVASSANDLLEKLQRAQSDLIDGNKQEIKDPRGIYFADTSEIKNEAAGRKIAFLFPGQGSQQVNMLRDLSIAFPQVRRTFERADESLEEILGRKLTSYIFPPPAFTEGETENQKNALTNTHIAQPAVGAADIAMYRLLQSLNIKPDMTAGHSYGEYAALQAAGCLSEEDLYRISEIRGRLFAEARDGQKGTMAAVTGEAEDIRRLLSTMQGITLANINAPNQCVISGEYSVVENALTALKKEKISARTIPVSQAFHSEHMAHAQQPLRASLKKLNLSSPKVPTYSNLDARVYAGSKDEIVERLTSHIVHPVDFVAQIRNMQKDGAYYFIEVGPGSVLSNLVDSILGATPHLALPLDRSGRPGILQLLHTLAQLASQGVRFDVRPLFESRVVFEIQTNEPDSGKKKLVYLVNSTQIKRQGDQSPVTGAPVSASTALSQPQVRHSEPGAVIQNPNHAKETTTRMSTNEQATKNSTQGSARPPQSVHEFAAPPQSTQPPVPFQSVPTRPSQGNIDNVMMQFQRTMLEMTNSFLSTQQQVMIAYLNAKQGLPAAQQTQFTQQPLLQSPVQPVFPVYAQPAQTGNSPYVVPAPPPFAQTAQADPLSQSEHGDNGHNGHSLQKEAQHQSFVDGNGQDGNGNGNSHQSANQEELVAALLDIVSQRTGYPPEMLDPELDLEADLGIDSIKRVEILNSFRKLLPDQKQQELEGGLEQLAGTKTLKGIIDWIRADSGNGESTEKVSPTIQAIQSVSAGAPSPQARALQPEEPNGHKDSDNHKENRGGHNIKRAFVRVSELAAPVLNPIYEELPDGFVTVIVDDGNGTAKAIAQKLSRKKQACAVLSGKGTSLKKGSIFECNLADADSINKALDEIRTTMGRVGRLIHLGALSQKGFDQESAISATPARSLFLVAKACEPDFSDESIQPFGSIVAATRLGGAFASVEEDGADEFPVDASIPGLVKCLAKEWPHVRARALDFDRTCDANAIAELVLSECAAETEFELPQDAEQSAPPQKRIEIGYRNGKRVGLDVVIDSLDGKSDSGEIVISEESVILITGGARGITAEIALDLAQRFKPRLVLVGRSQLPQGEEDETTRHLTSMRDLKQAIMNVLKQEGGAKVSIAQVEARYQKLIREREIRQNLESLRHAGATVEYHALDVRDHEAFGAFVDRLYSAHGRIDGVIYGAGVIEDAYVKDKSLESFNRVFDTKVLGAYALSKHLKLDELKFLFFFSSVVGRTGNAGQCDYVSANEVLNKLSVKLNARHGARVASLMWGPWNAGMAQPELEAIFARYGWAMIAPAAGRKAFVDELLKGDRNQAELIIVAQLSGQGETPSPRGARISSGSAVRLHDGSCEFTLSLSPDTDLYLKDHTFDNVPVMPMAMALELMAEAVTSMYPGMTLRMVRRLDIPSGIVFDSKSKQLVVVAKESERSQSRLLVDAVVMSGTGARRSHFKATFELADGAALPGNGNGHGSFKEMPAFIPHRIQTLKDLDGINECVSNPPDKNEVYSTYMFHGPAFQGIQKVDVLGSDGIIGKLEGTRPSSCLSLKLSEEDRWTVDPMLIDSSMQLAGVWARQFLEITVLPTGFRHLIIVNADLFSANSFTGRVYITPGTTHRELTCDVAVYAESGELVYVIEGLGGVGSKSLNRLSSQTSRS